MPLSSNRIQTHSNILKTESNLIGQKSRISNINNIQNFNSNTNSNLNSNSIINDNKTSTTKINMKKRISTNLVDKNAYIKKQMVNSELVNFNGFVTLGDDGVKEICRIFHDKEFNRNKNSLHTSITLANLNTPSSQNFMKKNTLNEEKEKIQMRKSINFSESQKANENFNPKIKELRLTKCNLTDEGFSMLANCFEKNGSIQVLNLKGNKLKDKSLKNILNLIKNNKGLKQLIISQNLMTPDKREHIRINAKIYNPNIKIEV